MNQSDVKQEEIDKNAGSWTVEYHYGNGTNTIDYQRKITSYSEAIECALSSFIYQGKYGWDESCRELVRAHLFRFGYFGDGNRCYEDELRGLTRVEVYFEPTIKVDIGLPAGEKMIETQNEATVKKMKEENRQWFERNYGNKKAKKEEEK